MICPFCHSPESRVVDSRLAESGAAIRRRRECEACGRRFNTYERPEQVPFYVIKKDGRRELFDRGKILVGMTKACEKRPVSRQDIERIAQEIEGALRDRLATEVPARQIGDLVMARLRELDEVAYVRFASVYKEFRDVDSFVEEIRGLARQVPVKTHPQITLITQIPDKEDKT
ncbi:MAG TPA: transcriptional regulator NrdR [Armatimonadota bacterium]|nr:transcriptional regulator NrdR [Armatimonadota bacterium]